MSPIIQVDDEIYRLLEFARNITGLSYSDIIKRAAEVNRDKHLAEAEVRRELAEGSPGPFVPKVRHQVDVRHEQSGIAIVVEDVPTRLQLHAPDNETNPRADRGEGVTFFAEYARPADSDQPDETLEAPESSRVLESSEASEVPFGGMKPTAPRLRAMVKSGFLPPGTELAYTVKDGPVYVFRVSKGGGLLYNRRTYATPGEAIHAAHGKRGSNAWDRVVNPKGVTLRELLHQYETSLQA